MPFPILKSFGPPLLFTSDGLFPFIAFLKPFDPLTEPDFMVMVLDLYHTAPKYVIHDFASARDKDMLVATILSPKDPPIPKTN